MKKHRKLASIHKDRCAIQKRTTELDPLNNLNAVSLISLQPCKEMVSKGMLW